MPGTRSILKLCCVVALTLSGACTQEQAETVTKEAERAAKDAGRTVERASKELARDAKRLSKDASAKAGRALKREARAAEREARAVERQAQRQLDRWGDQTWRALERGAQEAKGSAEEVLARGYEGGLETAAKLGPTALEIGKVLWKAVDKDVEIDPIVQRADDEVRKAELDKAIEDMPRVEAIDGVKVGFKSLDHSDAKKSRTESSYLVLWRKGDYLLGFVYRSKREIDIETLVAESPRLMKMASEAVG